MSENFSNFGSIKTNSRPFNYSSNSSSSSSNHSKIAEKVEKISIGNYGDKSLEELILKEVEKVAENIEKRLEKIRRSTDDDEFRLRIRNIIKTLKTKKMQADTQIINIKKFVDIYVKKKNDQNAIDIFIPGLDDNRKLGRFDLPDIIGFTEDDAIRKEKGPFLRSLTLKILGLSESSSLKDELKSLGQSITTDASPSNIDQSSLTTNSLANLNNVNNLIKGNSAYTLIYYWRMYAQLLNMISKEGKVDFELFMKTRKTDDDKKEKQKQDIKSLLLRGGGKFKGKKPKPFQRPGQKGQQQQSKQQKQKQKQQSSQGQSSNKDRLSASDQKLFNLVAEIEGWGYDKANVLNDIRENGKQRYKNLMDELIKKYLDHVENKNNKNNKIKKYLPEIKDTNKTNSETFYKEMSKGSVKELTYFRDWLKGQDSWFARNIISENNILDVLTYKERKSSDKKNGTNKYLYLISKGAEMFYNQYDIGFFASIDQDPVELKKLRDRVITGILTYLITIRKVYINLINRLESTYGQYLENRAKNKNQKKNRNNNSNENENENNTNNENENNTNNENKAKQKQIQQIRNMLGKIKEQLKEVGNNSEKRAKLLEIRTKVISKLKELDA
jgi:hypothetical protein